jgi:predicted transcriptional regulator
MELKDYLSQTETTQEAFAKKVQLPQSVISRLSRGLTMPAWHTVATIHMATGGRVTAEDWFGSYLTRVKKARKKERAA